MQKQQQKEKQRCEIIINQITSCSLSCSVYCSSYTHHAFSNIPQQLHCRQCYARSGLIAQQDVQRAKPFRENMVIHLDGVVIITAHCFQSLSSVHHLFKNKFYIRFLVIQTSEIVESLLRHCSQSGCLNLHHKLIALFLLSDF